MTNQIDRYVVFWLENNKGNLTYAKTQKEARYTLVLRCKRLEDMLIYDSYDNKFVLAKPTRRQAERLAKMAKTIRNVYRNEGRFSYG